MPASYAQRFLHLVQGYFVGCEHPFWCTGYRVNCLEALFQTWMENICFHALLRPDFFTGIMVSGWAMTCFSFSPGCFFQKMGLSLCSFPNEIPLLILFLNQISIPPHLPFTTWDIIIWMLLEGKPATKFSASEKCVQISIISPTKRRTREVWFPVVLCCFGAWLWLSFDSCCSFFLDGGAKCIIAA